MPSTDEGLLTASLDLGIARKSNQSSEILPLILPSKEDLGVGELTPDLSELVATSDPLLALPIQVGGRIVAAGSLGFVVSGLAYLVDPEQPAHNVDEVTVVDNIVVGTGDIDRNRAAEALRSGTDDILGELSFDVVGEHDGFTLYSPTADSVDGVTAVGESAVISTDTRQDVKRAVSTWQGDHPRAIDQDTPMDWLMDAAGGGHLSVGWLGPVALEEYYFGTPAEIPDDESLSTRDDLFSSVAFSPGKKRVTAKLALDTGTSKTPSNERLASDLGTESEDASFSVDGDRVSATATYTSDVLDMEYVEPSTRTPATTRSTEIAPPPEVANAVPADAFEFSYNESERSVRVSIQKAIEADEVTITTAETEWETSTTTPMKGLYLTVYVDPDGDEVVVTVAVDGVSGVVARHEIP